MTPLMMSLPVSVYLPHWDISPCSRSYWCCSAVAQKHRSVCTKTQESVQTHFNCLDSLENCDFKWLSLYMRVKAVVPEQSHKLNDLLQMLVTVGLVCDKHFPCVGKNKWHTCERAKHRSTRANLRLQHLTWLYFHYSRSFGCVDRK